MEQIVFLDRILHNIHLIRDKVLEHCVSEWSRYLTADRTVRGSRTALANNYMHQSTLIKLAGHIENLHRVNELVLGPKSIP